MFLNLEDVSVNTQKLDSLPVVTPRLVNTDYVETFSIRPNGDGGLTYLKVEHGGETRWYYFGPGDMSNKERAQRFSDMQSSIRRDEQLAWSYAADLTARAGGKDLPL
jgi:hypothetical protein